MGRGGFVGFGGRRGRGWGGQCAGGAGGGRRDFVDIGGCGGG